MSDPAWAWSPYEPAAERPWNLRWAGHLYRRAAFGADWRELQQAVKAGPQATIEQLLAPGDQVEEFNAVQDDYEKAAAQSASTDSMRAWWLRRMCQTPFPVLEKMTLFWHNHFAISGDRVSNAALMCRYHQHLRKHALGNFGALLEGVLDQPAVFAGLQAHVNHRVRTGEDLPRVLLEEFTVGPGHFTETDVQAAARALTGWFISQNELRYSERQHVSTPGTLFGQTGNFNKQDLIRILLRQRATAESVVRNLYRWLISETAEPSEAAVAPLVDRFARDLDIAALAGTMLRSKLFFSEEAYRQKIKSPVEFALGIIRPLKGMVGTVQLGADVAALGQDLFNPPTVAGWARHTCWINRYTMVARARLAEALLADSGAYGGRLNVREAAARAGRTEPKQAADYLVDLFLQGDLPPEVGQVITRGVQDGDGNGQGPGEHLRRMTVQIACIPAFHLA